MENSPKPEKTVCRQICIYLPGTLWCPDPRTVQARLGLEQPTASPWAHGLPSFGEQEELWWLCRDTQTDQDAEKQFCIPHLEETCWTYFFV